MYSPAAFVVRVLLRALGYRTHSRFPAEIRANRTATGCAVAIIAISLVTGCAQHYTPAAFAEPYRFFSGIWHGIVFLFALVANIVSWLLSLFGIELFSNIQIIGRPNTGFFTMLGLCSGWHHMKAARKNKYGTATVYGLAADRVGNGWWLLMAQDLIDYSDIKTGKTGEFKLEPEKIVLESLTDAQNKMYETFQPPDFNTPFAWAQAPRRMGADKNGDYVWVGNSFGGTMAKINIHTKETTLIPLPNPEAHQPYQVSIDKDHNVWTNLWSTDKVAKYDPSADKWTLFDMPIRGTESRHISLPEQPGKPLKVVIPYERARKVGVMTPRSEAEINALKARVGR